MFPQLTFNVKRQLKEDTGVADSARLYVPSSDGLSMNVVISVTRALALCGVSLCAALTLISHLLTYPRGLCSSDAFPHMALNIPPNIHLFLRTVLNWWWCSLQELMGCKTRAIAFRINSSSCSARTFFTQRVLMLADLQQLYIWRDFCSVPTSTVLLCCLLPT